MFQIHFNQYCVDHVQLRVEDLMRHEAGLANWDQKLTLQDIQPDNVKVKLLIMFLQNTVPKLCLNFRAKNMITSLRGHDNGKMRT
jgi:hypothetical protein